MGHSHTAHLRILIALVSLVCSRWSAAGTVSDWTGASGNWSSDGSPGWNGTGIPNAPEATARKLISGNVTTTQDIVGGVTVGTINLGGSSANHWTISTSNPITLNQDGAGLGFATISNTVATGSSSLYLRGSSGLQLADDLLFKNTSGSQSFFGAIELNTPITGNGDVTFYNDTNTYPNGQYWQGEGNVGAGAIYVREQNSFTGNVLIKKGLVTAYYSSGLGNSSNVITLGEAGQGGAILNYNSYNPGLIPPLYIQNPIVVAANAGGPIILGSNSLQGAVFAGNITLHGSLTITSGDGGSSNDAILSGNISGAGGITHFGNGTGNVGRNTLSGTNTYTGPTTVTSGALYFAKRASLYAGNPSSWTAENLTVNSGATAVFYAGGDGEFTAADIGVLGSLGTATGGFQNGTTIGIRTNGDLALSTPITGGASSVGLWKLGARKLTLSGANTYTGTTLINAGALLVNGTHTGGADYTLSASGSATLGGTGTIGSNVIVNSNGFVAPGDGIGTLTTTGNVTLNGSKATLGIEYSGTAIDKLVVGGTLNITGAKIDFNALGGLTAGSRIFASYGSLVGSFGNVLDLPTGFTIDYNYLGTNQIALVGGVYPGDFDGDYDVDGADFVAWQSNFPKASGATRAQGDADGDGDVDGADFVVWQTNFPFTPGAGASPVPEPSALLLGLISAAGLLAVRRR